jgi:hypothetical protein
MEYDQFVTEVEKLVDKVNSEASDMITVAANELISKVTQRIRNKGEGARGAFTAYSQKTSFAGRKTFKTQQAFNAFIMEGKKTKGLKGKRGVKPMRDVVEWRTINTPSGKRSLMLLEGGYKKLRELHGLSTQNKDFYWEGTMLKSIAASKPVKEGLKTTVIIGSNIGELEDLKLKGHAKREGYNILTPTQDEVQAIMNIIQERINNIVKNG